MSSYQEKDTNEKIIKELLLNQDISESEDIASPKSDHFAPSDYSGNGNGDLEKEYDFGSASSRRESDEGSWETVSEELREERMMDEELGESELVEHENDGECFCNTCAMKSLSISARMQSRTLAREFTLPENVSKVVTSDGSELYVIGTAHFSKVSQDDVEKAIQYLSPDVVMVELCASRVGVLKYDEESLMKAAQDVNLAKLKQAIKESGSVVSGVMQILLLSMSAHITKQLGMAPGGEFRVAAKQARSIPGCRLVLGDRPIQATLGRAMASLSIYQKLKLGWHLVFSKDNITKEDVEKYKQKDMIAEMLAEMTGDFPELSRVFVDERDEYMAQMLVHCADIVKHDLPSIIKVEMKKGIEQSNNEKIENVDTDTVNPNIMMAANDNTVEHSVFDEEDLHMIIPRDEYKPVVVGVVGIGHMDGIMKNIGKKFDLNELNKVPDASMSSRAFKLFLKSAVVAAFSWGVYSIVKWVRT